MVMAHTWRIYELSLIIPTSETIPHEVPNNSYTEENAVRSQCCKMAMRDSNG